MMLSRHAAVRRTISRTAMRSFASTPGKSSSDSSTQKTAWTLGAAALLGAFAAGGVTALEAASADPSWPHKRPTQKYDSPEMNPIHSKDTHQSDYNDPPARPDLPTIPLEDVAEHNDEESMWFTFRGAVYDMTFFILGHPGGTPVSYTLTVIALPLSLLSFLLTIPFTRPVPAFVDGCWTRLGTILGSLSPTPSWACRHMDGKVPYR